MEPNESPSVVRHLSIVDAICVIVGIVVGAMIFKAPAWVAGCTGSGAVMMLTWLAGGLLCFCGALCYAELASTYPQVGGEYAYLTRAFSGSVGFLFVWARATVIQTGSIAMLAYVFGDYLAEVFAWAQPAPMLLALAAVAVLTTCNVIGLRAGTWTQNVLTIAKVAGVLGMVVVGLWIADPAPAPAPTTAAATTGSAWPSFDALGLAMVFVLYTFGGWNEAAYVAGELRSKRRAMLWVLLGSLGLITALYLAVNGAYLRVLGIDGMAGARGAVAADAMQQALGPAGRVAVTVLVAVSALAGLDGCIFTGSRALCALGNDYPLFRRLGRWHPRFRTPANAIWLQSAVAVVLIVLPGLGRWSSETLGSGFETAAEYTMPAFWAFFLLVAVAVFVLRVRDPKAERPFRVPLLPVTGGLFALTCAWMLYRSLDYRLGGAMVGLVVLLAGVPVWFLCRRRTTATT